ncbi:MAG: DUF1521 domain-containing protein [Vulcanimicrobiota bacterium]
MSVIPMKPHEGLSPAGPVYQHNSTAFVRNQTEQGNMDGYEKRILNHEQQGISNRVEWNKDNNLDPRHDPVLARQQLDYRASANLFANFNPDQAGEGSQASGGRVSPGQGSQEGRPQGPQTFTDKDGNEVTKTPDGYTSVKNADGTTTTLTPGGYEIKYDSANSTATITDSKSGESSTIWGDPHVSESDGGSWEWQSETSSYVLPDGTKITMNSTGGDSSNGYGTLESMDIYSGQGRTHINSSADGTTLAGDRRQADNAQSDGDLYIGNLQANGWKQLSNEEMGA